jgi:hypothetical protein
MVKTGDPALEAFRNRKDPDKISRFMEKQRKKIRGKVNHMIPKLGYDIIPFDPDKFQHATP